MSRGITVHHFVANHTTRRYGAAQRSSDLLDVNYWYEVAADTEFPHNLGRMDVFTRFYLVQAKPTRYVLRVWWIDHPGGRPERIGRVGPFRVDFRPDETVRDVCFHLRSIILRGSGRHRIDLLLPIRRGWETGRLIRLAQTHFRVER